MHVDITYFSDTHGQHNKLKIPKSDLIICGGDFTLRGREKEVEDFLKWFDKLEASHKVLVAGNHDTCFDKKLQPAVYGTYLQKRPIWLEDMLNYYMNPLNGNYYLENEYCEPWGIKIWGSPCTMRERESFQSAFKLETGVDAEQLYSTIPSDTNIIVSHGPAYRRLDEVYCTPDNLHLGSEQLLYHVYRVKPTFLFCGHVHQDHGYMLDPNENIDTMYYNGCICDAFDRPTHSPWKIVLPL